MAYLYRDIAIIISLYTFKVVEIYHPVILIAKSHDFYCLLLMLHSDVAEMFIHLLVRILSNSHIFVTFGIDILNFWSAFPVFMSLLVRIPSFQFALILNFREKLFSLHSSGIVMNSCLTLIMCSNVISYHYSIMIFWFCIATKQCLLNTVTHMDFHFYCQSSSNKILSSFFSWMCLLKCLGQDLQYISFWSI